MEGRAVCLGDINDMARDFCRTWLCELSNLGDNGDKGCIDDDIEFLPNGILVTDI